MVPGTSGECATPAGSGSKASAFADLMDGTRRRLDAHPWRESFMRWFIRVEDVVYLGLGAILATVALVLFVAAAIAFGQAVLAQTLPRHAVDLLDRLLLILMIVEVLYTVQVSFSEHALTPEPFLIVGLLAAIRRLLVITAEFAHLVDSNSTAFRGAMLELGLLTIIIVALVGSLIALKRHAPQGA
jgi:phosphate-starvation-inducible protein E